MQSRHSSTHRRSPLPFLGFLGAVLGLFLSIESAVACSGPILPTGSVCEDCGTVGCYTPNAIIPAPGGCCDVDYKCVADAQGQVGYCKYMPTAPACSGGRIFITTPPPGDCVCPFNKPRWNATTSMCEACPGGQTWNTTTSACECPAGTTWNATTSMCECPGGRTWNTTTRVCECSGGRTWNATTSTCDCSGGRTWNATTSACECPAGQTWNATTSACEVSGGGGGPGGTIKSPIIRGDCRANYSETTTCQSPEWIALDVNYTIGGTVVPNNTDCNGNDFLADPNCSGKAAGTILPGSVQFSTGVGFCGAFVCQGGSNATPDLTGASGQRTNCNGTAAAFTLDFSDPLVTNKKCLRNCTAPRELKSDGRCDCPTGANSYWDGTACVPPPDLSLHRCDLTSPGITGAGFTAMNQVVNPKLACCTRGWGTDLPGASQEAFRLDCVEETDLVSRGFTTFDQFYNYNSATPDDIRDAGLNFPNRLFLVDPVSGIPISGFYNSRGERCGYTPSTLTISVQMNLFDQAISTGQVPAQIRNKDCTRLVRQALEVQCPPNPGTGNRTLTFSPAAGIRRCTGAGKLIIHTDIRDFASSVSTARGASAFRTMTTYTGGLGTTPGDLVKGYVLPKEIPYPVVIDGVYRATTPRNCSQINRALKRDTRSGFCVINQ